MESFNSTRRHRDRRNRLRGFTLIEVMIVVVVVAVLAAIAYPNYENAVLKSKRGQVKGDLVELAQRFERYHTVNNKYDGFWATVPPAQRVSPRDGAEGTVAYELEAVEGANTYTLTASPKNRQTRDTRCGTLTLDQAGAKTRSGTASLSECW